MHVARRPAGTRVAARLSPERLSPARLSPSDVAPIRRTDDEAHPRASAPADPAHSGSLPKPVAALARTYAQVRSEAPVVAGVVARGGRVAASRLRLLAGSATSLLSGAHSDVTRVPEDRLESPAAVEVPVELPPADVEVPTETALPTAVEPPPTAVEPPPTAVEPPGAVAEAIEVHADEPIEAEAAVPPCPSMPALPPVPGASSTALIASAEDLVGPVEIAPPATPRVETAVDPDFALLGLSSADLPPARRHRRVRAELLVAAGVVSVLVAAFLLILAGRDRRESADAGYSPLPSSASASSATAPPSVASGAASSAASKVMSHRRDAIKWMQANLYPTDFIAADAPTAVELSRYGFRNVHAVDGAQQISARVQFVAATGDPAAAATTLHALLARSIPVAKFGKGADATTVSEVQSADAKALARMLSRNRTARLAAGRQLSLNSRLTVGPGVQPVIRKGSLDLRAETLLALLTQNGDVRLDAAPQNAAERHADVPIRTVVVTVKDVKKARTTIAGLPAGYHAQSMQDEPGSHLTVEFPVRGVPAMPVS